VENNSGELGAIQQQMKHFSEVLTEIKNALSELRQIDIALAEISQKTQSNREIINNLCEKYESTLSSIGAHRSEISEEVLSVDRKVDAFTNQAKGASWAAGITLGVLLMIIVSSVGWIFGSVGVLREDSALLKYKVEQLSQNPKP
jgi:prefoldin subunit 5